MTSPGGTTRSILVRKHHFDISFGAAGHWEMHHALRVLGTSHLVAQGNADTQKGWLELRHIAREHLRGCKDLMNGPIVMEGL